MPKIRTDFDNLPNQDIHYLNTHPGVGKTYLIISELIKFANNKDFDGYCFYVAPTHTLLQQTKDDLLRRGAPQEKIRHIVASKVTATIKQTVRQKLDLQLSGHSGVHPRFKSELTVTAAPPGSIILMTHVAFASIQNFPQKSKTRVYFDEARKFVLPYKGGVQFKDPKQANFIRWFMSNFSKKIESAKTGNFRLVSVPFDRKILMPTDNSWEPQGVTDKDPKSISSARIKLKLSSSGLSDLNKFTRIRNLLEKAKNPYIDFYVHSSFNLPEGIDYDPESATQEDYEKIDSQAEGSNRKYEFMEVQIPSRIFRGYNFVLLAAAYIRDSQMYSLFQQAKNVSLVDFETKFPIKCKHLTKAKRIIESRLSQLTLIPLTMGKNKLSKFQFECGLSLPSYNEEYLIDHLTSHGCKTPGDLILLKSLAAGEIENSVLSKNQSSILEKFKELKVTFNVLDNLVESSVAYMKLLKDSVTGKSLITGLPLLVLNKDFVGDINPKWLDEDDLKFTLISSAMQGSNEYKDRNTMVYLAAINPPPRLYELLQRILPLYNPDKDHAAEAAAQSITRLSVRDHESEERVFAFIPDMEIVKYVQEKFEHSVIDDTWAKKTELSISTFSYLLHDFAISSRPRLNPELVDSRVKKKYLQTNISRYKNKVPLRPKSVETMKRLNKELDEVVKTIIFLETTNKYIGVKEL